MNLHLLKIERAIAPGAHAVLLVDQAGWHMSARLVVPQNITIIALPSKCPELNPVENVWEFMRDNGSPTASSVPTMTWSIIAVTPGTSSSTSPGGSCPSVCANGRTGSHQKDLVLANNRFMSAYEAKADPAQQQALRSSVTQRIRREGERIERGGNGPRPPP
jgi:hypothetical protein